MNLMAKLMLGIGSLGGSARNGIEDISLSSVTSALIVVVAARVVSFTGYVITTIGAVMSGFRLSKASSHENIKSNIGSSSFFTYSTTL